MAISMMFIGGYLLEIYHFKIISYTDNDPKPSDPANSHGTHTAGLASATTDNGKGIAGTGFNCKLIPIKAGSDTSLIWWNIGRLRRYFVCFDVGR